MDERIANLIAVVGEVLGVSGVTATDSFIDLGGDSLSATLVSIELELHGIAIDPVDLTYADSLGDAAARAVSP